MSKTKRGRRKRQVEPKSQSKAQTTPQPARRKFLALGLGGLGTLAAGGFVGYKAGWFGSSPAPATSPASAVPATATVNPLPVATLPADYPNALRAADEIVRHYARELKYPSAVIHAVRAFGRNFTLNDGAKAVDFLCSRFAVEREVNGQRYVHFPRETEVHDNSFLKTMLEAGVSLDQPITAGGNKYTLRDLGESAKSLFRCDPRDLARHDPKLMHQHLPWGLIALSILAPPSKSTWVNAYGETINLPEVIDRSLAVYEGVCADVKKTVARGEMESLEFRQEIAKYSCFGMHTAYSYFSCLKHGYRHNNLPSRLNQLADSLIHRLKWDALAIDREADAVKEQGPEMIGRLAVEGQGGKILTHGSPPPNTLEVWRARKQIQMLGHALEAINYGLLHKLLTLTPDQKQRAREGERMLHEQLVKIRATDLAPFARWYGKFVSDLVIAVAHASRAMKLLTPDNPDTIA